MTDHETSEFIEIECPECSAELELDASCAGEKVACAACNAVLLVPALEGEAAGQASAPGDVWNKNRWAKYEKTAKEGGGNPGRLLIKIFLGFAVIALLASGAVYLFNSLPKSKVPKYLPGDALMYFRASNLEDLQKALKKADLEPPQDELLSGILYRAATGAKMIHFALLDGKGGGKPLLVVERQKDDGMGKGLSSLEDDSKKVEDVDGVTVYEYKDDDWNYWAADDDVMVLGADKESVTDFLTGRNAPADDSLAKSKTFSSARSENGGQDMFFYMPLDAIPRMAGMNKKQEKMLEQILGDLDGRAVSAGMKSDGTQASFSVDRPKDNDIWNDMMAGVKPVDSAMLEYVPQSAMGYLAFGKLGTQKAWENALEEMEKTVKKNGSSHDILNFKQATSEFEKMLGLEVVEIPELITGLCVCIDSNFKDGNDAQGFAENLAIIVKVSDVDEAKDLIKTLTKKLAPNAKKSTDDHKSVEITSFARKNPFSGKMQDVVSYAFSKDYLIVGPTSQAIENCIDAKSGKNVTDSKNHKSTVTRFHNKGYMRVYLDISKYIEKTDERSRKQIEGVFAANQAIAASIKIDGKRVTLRVSQNKPIKVEKLTKFLGKSREKARRANCSGNLKQIGLACLFYSGEQNGRFPKDLATLVESGELQASKVYICPSGSESAPVTAADIRAGKCSYLYFGNGVRDDDRDATRKVIACDKPGNHSGEWINALFVDGHVEGCEAGSIEEAAQKSGWIIPKKIRYR